MKKIALFAATALALAMTSTPASAQLKTGGRVEALAGYDNARFGLSNLGGTGHLSANGAVFGVGAGFDFAPSAKVALGIDLEASAATSKIESTSGTTTDKIKASRDLYVGGRVTIAASDRVNLYLKAGYSNARLKAAESTNGTVTLSDSTTLDGVRGGAGVQFLVGQNMYLGGEYRYTNYNNDVSRHQFVGTLGFHF
jgi:outer membrane immunogenic protein